MKIYIFYYFLNVVVFRVSFGRVIIVLSILCMLSLVVFSDIL